MDEAGKLARFRARFGGAFDAALPTKAAAAATAAAVSSPEVDASAAKGGKNLKKKAAAAEEELKKAEEEKKAAEKAAEAEAGGEDMFADLMASFVVDQPNLKGGRIAGKDTKKGKKK